MVLERIIDLFTHITVSHGYKVRSQYSNSNPSEKQDTNKLTAIAYVPFHLFLHWVGFCWRKKQKVRENLHQINSHLKSGFWGSLRIIQNLIRPVKQFDQKKTLWELKKQLKRLSNCSGTAYKEKQLLRRNIKEVWRTCLRSLPVF